MRKCLPGLVGIVCTFASAHVLACSFAPRGVYPPFGNSPTVPRNAVIFATAIGLPDGNEVHEGQAVFDSGDTTSILTERSAHRMPVSLAGPSQSLLRSGLPVDSLSGPVVMTIVGASGDFKADVALVVADEVDTSPPGTPTIVGTDLTFQAKVEHGDGVSCAPSHAVTAIQFRATLVSDGFGIQIYSVVDADTGEVVGWRHAQGVGETLLITVHELGDDPGKRCYRVVAHDFADNQSASDEVCLDLSLGRGCGCTLAESADLNSPQAVFLGWVLISLIGLARRLKR